MSAQSCKFCATSHPIVRVWAACYREDVGQKMFCCQVDFTVLAPANHVYCMAQYGEDFFGNTSGGIRAALLRWGSWPNVAD